MPGLTGNGTVTNGVALGSSNTISSGGVAYPRNYIIATTAGVRLTHWYNDGTNDNECTFVLSANHLAWEGGYSNFDGSVYLNRHYDSSTGYSYTDDVTHVHTLYGHSSETNISGLRMYGGSSASAFGEITTYNTETDASHRLVEIGRLSGNGYIAICHGATVLATLSADSTNGGCLTLYDANGANGRVLTYADLVSWNCAVAT